MDAKNQNAKRWLVPALLGVVIVLLLLIAALFLNREQETVDISDGDVPKLGYAEGVTVVEDPDALQKAVDEMYKKAREPGISLEYKGVASSEDGENFSCYIANAADNAYDMYIQIFGDAELTDQLFLSGLLRPGSAFDNITLEHSLDPGSHTVYVAFTQVEEDLQTVHGQVLVTMEFSVES